MTKTSHLWECYCGLKFKDPNERTSHAQTCDAYLERNPSSGKIKMRSAWVNALIDARHELHYDPDRWANWNEIEDFFWDWLMAVRGGR